MTLCWHCEARCGKSGAPLLTMSSMGKGRRASAKLNRRPRQIRNRDHLQKDPFSKPSWDSSRSAEPDACCAGPSFCSRSSSARRIAAARPAPQRVQPDASKAARVWGRQHCTVCFADGRVTSPPSSHGMRGSTSIRRPIRILSWIDLKPPIEAVHKEQLGARQLYRRTQCRCPVSRDLFAPLEKLGY
jgi:hypothetical protein